MSTQDYGITVYVDASGSTQGAREFKRSQADMAATARKIESETMRASKSLQGLGIAALQVKHLLGGIAAGFTLGTALRQIAGFEAAMSRIKSLMGTNPVASELAAIEREARRLGATTVYSAGEAADAMAELVKAGMSASQAVKSAGSALSLAAADNLSMAEAASITANILATFKLRAEEAGRAADVLAHAANASQTDVRGVGAAMRYVGPLAATLGVSLEDTAAAIGALSNAGIDASMAGTSLRQVIAGLMNVTPKAEKAMQSMGVTTAELRNLLTQEDGLVKMVQRLAKAQRELGDDTAFAGNVMQLLGDRGGPALLALIGQLPGLQKLTTEMKNVAGTADTMAKAMTDNLIGDFKEIQSAFEELAIQLGESGVRGTLRALAQDVGAFLRGLAGLPEQMDSATRAMTALNNAGQLLRENVGLLKDLVVLLATVFISRYVTALATVGVRTVRQTALNVAFAASWRQVAIGAGTATKGMQAAAIAGAGLRGVMALLGGPLGVVTLAATALMLFTGQAEDSALPVDVLKGKLDSLGEGFADLGREAQIAALKMAAALGMELDAKKAELTSQLQMDKEAREREAEIMRSVEWMKRAPGPGAIASQAAGGIGLFINDRNKLAEADRLRKEAELLQVQDQIDAYNKRIPKLLSSFNAVKLPAVSVTAKVPASGGGGGGTTPPTEEELKAAQAAADEFAKALGGLRAQYAPLAEENAKYTEDLALLNKALALGDEGLKKYGLTTGDVQLAIQNLTSEHQKALLALDPTAKVVQQLTEDYAAQRKELQPLAVLQEAHNKKIEQLNTVLALSDDKLKEYGTSREELVRILGMENDAFARSTKEIEENTRKLAENGTGAEAWQKAWEKAVERIDGMFVGLWKSMLGGTSDFVDQLKDTFKNLFAEIMHANITRPFTNWLSSLFAPKNTASNAGFLGSTSNGGWMDAVVGKVVDWFSGGSRNAGMTTAGGGWGGALLSVGGSLLSGGSGGSWLGMASGAASSGFGGGASGWGAFAPMVTTGYGGGTGAFGSVMAAGAGGGGGDNAATQIGGLIAKGFIKYAPQIGSAVGAAAPYIAGAATVAGAYYGYTKTDSGMGAKLASGAAYAGLGYTAATIGIGAVTGAAGGAAVGAAGAGAASGAMGAAAAVPIVGWVLAVLALIDLASGGKLFGTKYRPDAATTALSIGAEGGDATQTITEVRNRSLFRGRKWRTREIEASEEAQKAADDLYQSIKNTMTEAAKALNVNVPPVIDATVKVINDLTKKGKVKSTSYEVTAGGVTRKVDTQEEALRWISVESLVEVMAQVHGSFRDFARTFDDNIEQMEQGVTALMGLATALGHDPVADAGKARADARKSGLERYREQLAGFDEVLAGFDGSLGSITRLTDATNALKKAQFDLAAAYYEVQTQASEMLQDTQRQIRESLMDPDALYESRQSEIQRLTSQLMGETDPAKLMDLASEINALTQDAWNMLDEGQREDLQGGFLSLLDQVEAILNERVGVGLDEITQDADELNQKLGERLAAVAAQMGAAVDNFGDAVDRFSGVVNGAGSGGGGRSRTATSELN